MFSFEREPWRLDRLHWCGAAVLGGLVMRAAMPLLAVSAAVVVLVEIWMGWRARKAA